MDQRLLLRQFFFNAPLRAEIDLTIPADRIEQPSLFERIERALKPLLGDFAV